MSQLGFEPIFESFGAVVVAAAGLLALLSLSPHFGTLTRRRLLVLRGLRLLSILLLIVALLRPTWITTIRTPRTSGFLVLLDLSRSMLLPSGTSEQRRWQAQIRALAESQSELKRLGARSEVRVYGYDQRLTPLEFNAGTIKFPEELRGEQTDIGTMLNEALRAEQGKALAGVLLLGDGTQTAFDPLVETQAAARKVRDDFAAPLYTVTFGLAGDAAQSRDVAVERLDEQFTVFVKNELVVRSLIRLRGYARQEIPVELLLTDQEGKQQAIGRKNVSVPEDNRQVEVEFPFTPTTPGHYRLTVRAARQEGEQVEKNNQLDSFLTVLEGGLRVLYLYGNLPFEQKAIRRAINASPDIELDDRYVDSRTRQTWPIDLGTEISSGKYDAFILSDLDAQALGPANLKALAEAVGQGKGLLMLGGQASFGRGHYRDSPLGDVLPIEIDRLEGAEFQEAELDRFFVRGPLKLVPIQRHAVTRLATGEENDAAWRKLPPLAWANRFLAVKQAPGTRVLLESPEGAPLLVSGEYGQGRTLAFAGESTYRWPLAGFAKEHNRFWRQIILWLVRRDDLERDDVWIKLDSRRLNPGTRLGIRSGARAAGGEMPANPRLETVLVHPDGRKESLDLARDRDDFRGSVQPTAAGEYAIEVTAFDGERSLGAAKAEFLVYDRDVEMSSPAADPDLMAALAAWTRAEGGRAVAPEELPKLLAELASKEPEFEVRQTRWRIAGTPADAWCLLLVLATTLGSEWFLRKRWGLV